MIDIDSIQHSVKMNIKQRVKTLLESMYEIETVIAYPLLDTPVKMDVMRFPMSVISEIDGRTSIIRNLTIMNSLPIQIETRIKDIWSNKESLDFAIDYMEATIDDLILNDLANKRGGLGLYAIKVEVGQSARASELDNMSILIQQYIITYRTTYGNSFNQVIQQ